MVSSDGSLCVLRVAAFTGDPVHITASDVMEIGCPCSTVRRERRKHVSAIKGCSRHRITPSPPIVPGALYTDLHFLNYSPEVWVISSRMAPIFRVLTAVTGAGGIHSLAFPCSALNLKEFLAILAMCLAFGSASHPVWYLNRNVPWDVKAVNGLM